MTLADSDSEGHLPPPARAAARRRHENYTASGKHGKLEDLYSTLVMTGNDHDIFIIILAHFIDSYIVSDSSQVDIISYTMFNFNIMIKCSSLPRHASLSAKLK